jgi:hypothetical protein
MHRTRNAAYGQPYRGFESLPLRQLVLSLVERNLSPEFSTTFQEVAGIHVLIIEARGHNSRSLVAVFSRILTYAILCFGSLMFIRRGFVLRTESSVFGLAHAKLFWFIIAIPALGGFVFGQAERRWIIQRLLLPFGINAAPPSLTNQDAVMICDIRRSLRNSRELWGTRNVA